MVVEVVGYPGAGATFVDDAGYGGAGLYPPGAVVPPYSWPGWGMPELLATTQKVRAASEWVTVSVHSYTPYMAMCIYSLQAQHNAHVVHAKTDNSAKQT